MRPISGGTALMLMMKAGVLRPRRLVSLRKLDLSGVETVSSGELHIGAMTTLGDLERAAAVKRGWPAITRTLRTLSNVRVRNVATVGGALAHGDPHMDLPPLMSALGARVVISGPAGQRRLPVEQLYKGYLENTLRSDELITRLEVPPLGRRRAAYLKCTTRSADDWPALGVAVVIDLQDDVARDISLVMSAATDKPTRLADTEKLLRGKRPEQKLIQQAAEAAAAEVTIESDMHGSAAYKKQLLRVYVQRVIDEARNALH